MQDRSLDRRNLLKQGAAAFALGAGAALTVPAQPARSENADSWFNLKDDDGKPVPNMRLPVELTGEIDHLRGVIWVGAQQPDVIVAQFHDYNCPYCRIAARDVKEKLAKNADLRVGLVNNPILSVHSVQAAKVELAVLALKGSATAAAFHDRLYEQKGTLDGLKALEVAARLGLPRDEIEARADGDEVRATLGEQMRLAAALGLSATPSFVISGAAVLGYPGRKSLDRMIASVRRCEAVICQS